MSLSSFSSLSFASLSPFVCCSTPSISCRPPHVLVSGPCNNGRALCTPTDLGCELARVRLKGSIERLQSLPVATPRHKHVILQLLFCSAAPCVRSCVLFR